MTENLVDVRKPVPSPRDLGGPYRAYTSFDSSTFEYHPSVLTEYPVDVRGLHAWVLWRLVDVRVPPSLFTILDSPLYWSDFNRDRRLTYKRYGCTWALLQPWALSNKLCIQSVVRVEPPLVICKVSFRSPRGSQHSKREKPWWLSIDSIAKVTYWPRFNSSQRLWRQTQR